MRWTRTLFILEGIELRTVFSLSAALLAGVVFAKGAGALSSSKLFVDFDYESGFFALVSLVIAAAIWALFIAIVRATAPRTILQFRSLEAYLKAQKDICIDLSHWPEKETMETNAWENKDDMSVRAISLVLSAFAVLFFLFLLAFYLFLQAFL